MLAVFVVFTGTVLGHVVVARMQAAAAVVPAPRLPPVAVVAAPTVGASVSALALDTLAGHVLVLARAVAPECPPDGACPPAPPATALVMLDARSGALLTREPLGGVSGPAARATQLLVDSTSHRAYAIAPSAVVTFSSTSGAPIGGFTVPGAPGVPISGAALSDHGARLLIASADALWLVRAVDGQVVARQNLPAVAAHTLLDGPVVTPAGTAFVLLGEGTGAPRLAAYDAATLRPLWMTTLPRGTRLGPVPPDATAPLVFGPAGQVWRIAAGHAASNGERPLLADGAWQGARALGWDTTLGHVMVAEPQGMHILSASTGRTLAGLPFTPVWPEWLALPVDTLLRQLYMPAASGSIVIVRDAPAAGFARDATSATLLARAALAHFLPNTGQSPPFIAPADFPVAPGTRALDYYEHSSDLGWEGPYAGTASVAASRAAAGGWDVSFRMSWDDLFVRQHTWVCAVAANGSVRLLSTAGDAVP